MRLQLEGEKYEPTKKVGSARDLKYHTYMNREMDNGNPGIPCPHDQTGNQVLGRKIRPFRSVVLVEDLVAQGAGVLACAGDAAMSEEGDHYPALVDARNLQWVVDRRNQVQVVVGCRSQVQVEGVDRAAASSVVAVDVVPVLGAGVALLQDGVEALGQGLAGKLEDGWQDWEDPWDLARLTLDRSSRQP